jgi:hypothetical protein
VDSSLIFRWLEICRWKTLPEDRRLGFRITETGVTARSEQRQIKDPAKSAAISERPIVAIRFALFRSCGNFNSIAAQALCLI